MEGVSCRVCGSMVDPQSMSLHLKSHERPPGPIQDGENLGTLLRDAVTIEMRHQGWNQTRLAEEVGVTQKHLSQMLTGRASGSIEMWTKIAAALSREWSVSLH